MSAKTPRTDKMLSDDSVRNADSHAHAVLRVAEIIGLARQLELENIKLREALERCRNSFDALAKESPSKNDERFIVYVFMGELCHVALKEA